MSSELDKEFIHIMPPIHHFKRAVIFKAAAKAFDSIGMYYEARKCEVDGLYELALGFEALVYESCVPPAYSSSKEPSALSGTTPRT